MTDRRHNAQFNWSLRKKSMLQVVARLTLTLLFMASSVSAGAQAVASAKMHGIVIKSVGRRYSRCDRGGYATGIGATTTATSAASGTFLFPNLPVAGYLIKITAPGSQTYSRTGVVLQVSNDIETSAPLTIASTDSVVNVEAGASQVQTEDNSSTPSSTKLARLTCR